MAVNTDFQPNSHKFKEEQTRATRDTERRVKKVVAGTARTKKKSELSKLLSDYDDNLSEEENMANNGYYQIYDCGNYLFEKIYEK